MAVFSGKDGSLRWNNKAIARVRSWSVQSNLETLDVTDLGDDARAYVAGLKSATGNASIYYHDDNNNFRELLDNVINTGTPGSAQLELRWGGKKLNFTAFVTTASITCAVGEVMSADVSFQMTGDYDAITL